jgi:signal transduction histidine kinase
MIHFPNFKDRRWNSTTVSWAGFLLFSLIVLAIGLWGSRQIATLLEQEMVLHGVDHNRAVFQRILPQMRALIAQYPDPAQTLATFPREFAAAETLSMSILLVKRTNDHIIAHTEQPVPTDGRPLAALLSDMVVIPTQGDGHAGQAMAATSVHHMPVLLYRAAIVDQGVDQGYASDWDLVVETEMADVAGTSALMHQRVRLLLLTTDLLIILFGFFTLRRIGRHYERGLERQLVARTAELEVSHAQVLRQTTLATIGQTTSVLAHEMRNPLAAIKLSLSSLGQAEYLSERDHRRVALVLRETDRLDDLLSQTLDYVRPIRRSEQPTKVDGIIDRVVELLTPVAEDRGLKMERLDCPQCPPLRVDADQLQQALLNLVKNAIEASPAGGTIQINIKMKSRGWQVAINNRGKPIAPADRERIFDAFFTTRPKGTGLGLFLVKRVVSEHGGEVSVSSNAECGTTVTLTVRGPESQP